MSKNCNSAKITPQQKKALQTLALKDWRIRHHFAYGKFETYFKGDPLGTTLDQRIFESLRNKGLIEPDDKRPNLWRLSKAGREAATRRRERAGLFCFFHARFPQAHGDQL
jgi:hypothetical protein